MASPQSDHLLSGEPRDAIWAREHGFATEVVAPAALDARIAHWAKVLSRTSRAAVAATRRCCPETAIPAPLGSTPGGRG